MRIIRLHKRPTPRTGVTAEGCVTRLLQCSIPSRIGAGSDLFTQTSRKSAAPGFAMFEAGISTADIKGFSSGLTLEVFAALCDNIVIAALVDLDMWPARLFGKSESR